VTSLLENETFTEESAPNPARFAGVELYRCAFQGVKWPELRLEGAAAPSTTAI
jgi:hypothetical protein